MARMTAQEFADKWARNTSAATGEYVKGIQRVPEAPGVKAAAKAEKMRAGINAAIDSGKWGERVAAVPLSVWKEAAATKGAPRIAEGVRQATGDMASFGGQLLAHIDNVGARIEQMPDNTLEERLARMVEHARGMSEFKRT